MTESFENWEAKWDEEAKIAALHTPLKRLRVLPDMPGIAPNERKFLKWKSFKYIFFSEEGKKVARHLFQSPFFYAYHYVKSLFSKSFHREGDFFLYGVKSLKHFETLLTNKEAILVVGFSYCQKPFECPSKRFSDQCVHDRKNPICQQCDIGKALHALPEHRVEPLIIPTVHYVGEKMFQIVEKYRGKKIHFLITACEMTLKMFADFGNMLNVQGVGVRLDGRICNTMKAFILSENGIKPGLTVLTPDTQRKVLNLIRTFSGR